MKKVCWETGILPWLKSAEQFLVESVGSVCADVVTVFKAFCSWFNDSLDLEVLDFLALFSDKRERPFLLGRPNLIRSHRVSCVTAVHLFFRFNLPSSTLSALGRLLWRASRISALEDLRNLVVGSSRPEPYYLSPGGVVGDNGIDGLRRFDGMTMKNRYRWN